MKQMDQSDLRKYLFSSVIVVMVVLVDAVLKYSIQNSLALHEEISVIDGFFNINYIHNFGAAFGLMGGSSPQVRKLFFLVTTTAAIFVILILLKKNKISQQIENIGLSLILGGALGNALNRAHLGYVIDFIHFHWKNLYHFPSFNIADIAICFGVGVLTFHQFIAVRLSLQSRALQ